MFHEEFPGITYIAYGKDVDKPARPESVAHAYVANDTGVVYVSDDTRHWSVVGSSATGGVTSVAVDVPTDLLSVTGSPITTDGTITLSKASGTPPNMVYASPDGLTGAATFRSLVQSDLPTHSHTASDVTSGVLPPSRGGTGSDLSTTGGASHVVKQLTPGGGFSASPLTSSEIPSLDASKITSGMFDPARIPPIEMQRFFAEVRYVVPRGANGVLVSANVWTTLPLNTIHSDPNNLVSLASNQMTLRSGRYVINAIAQVYFPDVGHCRLRLRNITSSNSVESANAYYPIGSFHTILVGTFYSNGTDQFALQIISSVTNTRVGVRANNVNFGDEIYITILLEKIS